MKVVLTAHFSPWSAYSGGGQRSTHNLALAMCRRGIDTTVVFARPPWEQVPVPAGLPYRLRWATLIARKSASGAVLRPLVPASLARVVAGLVHESHEPLVVHSNGEESALLPALRRVLPFGLIVTPRFPRLPDALTAGHRSLRDRARLVIRDTRYVQLGTAVRGADFVSPPSHFAGRMMQAAYGLDPSRLRPVHNGVPVEFLDHHWAPEDTERPLVFFGRFARDKGIDVLLAAIERLGPAAPRCLLVGRGPLRPELERAASASGGRIELRDWADHHTLGRLLAGASMAAIPSREENFSLAVLSAMAVGTPLVTTRVGGTAEVVEDGRNGLLVEADDPAALAGAIARLRDAPEDAARMGAAASEIVRRDFTWDVAAERFLSLYEQSLR